MLVLGLAHGVLVGFPERMPSKSCFGRDIDELLMLGAQKLFRICCTRGVG